VIATRWCRLPGFRSCRRAQDPRRGGRPRAGSATPDATPRDVPLIVLSQHCGPGDSVLVAWLLAVRYRMQLRWCSRRFFGASLYSIWLAIEVACACPEGAIRRAGTFGSWRNPSRAARRCCCSRRAPTSAGRWRNAISETAIDRQPARADSQRLLCRLPRPPLVATSSLPATACSHRRGAGC
jgi:hypothetical protein